MRIAIVGHKGFPATYGGVERICDTLARSLAKRGHQITTFSRRYYSQLPNVSQANLETVIVDGIRTKRLDTISHTVVSLARTLPRSFDVVAIHSFANAILNWIPKLKGTTVAVHLHGFEWASSKWNSLDKVVLHLPLITLRSFSDGITTVSQQQQTALRRYGIDAVYIPNGIWMSEDLARPTYSGRPYVLFVGRLVNKKGVEYLIQAFKKLDPHSIGLKIVGDHNASPGYLKRLRDLAGDDKRIDFLGFQYGENLQTLYRHSLCTVVPSEAEAFPLVLLEALMHHDRLLASDIPAIRDVAGEHVRYFRPADVDSLAAALKPFLDRPDDVPKTCHGRAFIESRYNWEWIVDQYERFYLSLCGQ